MRNATCPICDRLIDFQSLGTNMDGDPVLAFHYDRRTGSECRASRKSMKYALMIRERIDYNTGKADAS